MRKNSSTELPTSSEYTDIYYIEGISSSITLSPTLVDPARVSVIRAVDGQDTGLSAQPAENRLQTGIDQDFYLQSALVQASLLLKHQLTGQLKRTRLLTSSSTRSWSRDSLTRS